MKQITARLNTLVSSPKLAQSIDKLNATLAQAEMLLATVQPQVAPLLSKLNRAADEAIGTVEVARGVLSGEGPGALGQDANLATAMRELTDAARSIRALADYVGRHPESLLRGRAETPAPQRAKPAR